MRFDWEEEQEVTRAIWQAKYAHGDETHPHAMDMRVAGALYPKRAVDQRYADLVHVTGRRELVFGGRILAGAGTGLDVTLLNCFVVPELEDSMRTERGGNSLGIMDCLAVSAWTQQMGGGIGADFSPIRPRGALVRKRMAAASGPIAFMHMWDGMGTTVEAAGARRCAMMATLRCDHPDVADFVMAKHRAGFLTNFNVSVLVTDAFMRAVRAGDTWPLGSYHPRKDGQHEAVMQGVEGPWYVYQTTPASELWDLVLRSTYDHAEPGVIFIDRVNAANNLRYCEKISCTNPCGEQPLPPNNNCLLAATVLSSMVRDPFTPEAGFDYARLQHATRVAVEAMNRVVDVTAYPTPEMEAEGKAKRRIGLGVMGLGNALAMLRLRYGSDGAVEVTEKIMRCQAVAAYEMSCQLAASDGPFPAWDREGFMEGQFVRKLPRELQGRISRHGLRNGVLLTIAPTGTTSLYAGCVSGGVEPAFDHWMERTVRQPDDTKKSFRYEDHAHRLFRRVHGVDGEDPVLPDYMVTAMDGVSVDDHVRTQAACQGWVDASISKTINLPAETTFEDFRAVYDRAYDEGLKSCTTYRSNPVSGRGAVLTSGSTKAKTNGASPPEEVVRVATEIADTVVTAQTPAERPEVLPGKTYKARLNGGAAYYVTICDAVGEDGRPYPYEVFVNSRVAENQEWVAALTRMVSAIFRMKRGRDVEFVAEELGEVHSATGGGFYGRRHLPGVVAMLGVVLRRHLDGLRERDASPTSEHQATELGRQVVKGTSPRVEITLAGGTVSGAGGPGATPRGPTCPRCGSIVVRLYEGCRSCGDCGWSNCG